MSCTSAKGCPDGKAGLWAAQSTRASSSLSCPPLTPQWNSLPAIHHEISNPLNESRAVSAPAPDPTNPASLYPTVTGS